MVSILLTKFNYNKVINLPQNYGERFSDLSLKKKTLIKQVKLRSSAFNNQEKIPKKYRFDYGDNINPPFSIHKTPAKTESLVLIIEDLDTPNICINWVLWNIPAKTNEIREDETPEGSVVGKNFLDSNSYYGFCPVQGTHKYSFTVFALDKMLDLNPDSELGELINSIFDHILDYDQMTGYCDKIGEFILE